MSERKERNGSAQNGSKTLCKQETFPYLCETVRYRTVPKFLRKRSLNLPKLLKNEHQRTTEKHDKVGV